MSIEGEGNKSVCFVKVKGMLGIQFFYNLKLWKRHRLIVATREKWQGKGQVVREVLRTGREFDKHD